MPAHACSPQQAKLYRNKFIKSVRRIRIRARRDTSRYAINRATSKSAICAGISRSTTFSRRSFPSKDIIKLFIAMSMNAIERSVRQPCICRLCIGIDGHRHHRREIEEKWHIEVMVFPSYESKSHRVMQKYFHIKISGGERHLR